MSLLGNALLNLFEENFSLLISCVAPGLLGVALALIAGCQRKNTEPTAAVRSLPQASAILVNATNDVLRIQSSEAEFELSASGYLKAGLKRGEKVLTLDDPEKQVASSLR